MTTLPQTTTSIRLPRPSGNGQLVPANAGMPAMAGGGQAAGMSGNDVWRVLRSNIWMIIGVLICSGVLGYVAYYLIGKYIPSFTATGFVEVNPMAGYSDPLKNSSQAAPDSGAIFLEQKTQVTLLKNEQLLMKVLQNQGSEIRKTHWYVKFGGSFAAAKEDFIDHYYVSPVPETKLVRIEFQNIDPTDCKTIVDEIVEQHIKDQQELVLAQAQQHSVELTALQNRLRAKISTNEAMLGQYRAQLNEGGSGAGSRVSIKEMELEQLIGVQTALELKYKNRLAEYNAMQENINTGKDPAEVDDKVALDTQVAALRNAVINGQFRYDELAALVGPKDAKLNALLASNERFKNQLADAEGESRLRARNSVLEKARQEVNILKGDYEITTARVDELKSGLGDLSNVVAKYYTLMEEDKGLREQAKSASTQLDQLMTSVQTNLLKRVTWISHPGVPTTRSFPKLPMTMTVALLIGLALSVGMAFLRELTDTSVRSERDILRVGQMTLLGMVADESDDPQAAGARLPLVIFDAPHSMTAEQLRQVRTRLQHAASLDTTQSIMVTSAAPGDGKTTIACNLAAGLALNGRRILLVDANFRRPEIHKVFALGNDQGFSDVLNGTVAFEDMVQETQVPNLAVMTSGPKPINATEMFESQLLIDFIERALEEFDHVIFDSGPMMVVSESAAMAPRVDGVVTVVRARGSNRGQLQRMRDSLRATKAEHLGVVLNAVRAQGGGYYGRNIKTYYQYQNR